MATLEVKVNLSFETGPLIAHNEKTFREEELIGDAASKKFELVDPKMLALYVVALDPEEGGAAVGFEFDVKSMKKGGEFVVNLKDDASGLTGLATGSFVLKLRAGVAPMLEGYGDKIDFRLEGISYDGGAYNGFMARLAGQEEENFEEWLKIEEFILSNRSF